MRSIPRFLAIILYLFLFSHTYACSSETEPEISLLNTNDIPPPKAISTAFIHSFHDEIWGGPELYNNNRIELRSFTLETFEVVDHTLLIEIGIYSIPSKDFIDTLQLEERTKQLWDDLTSNKASMDWLYDQAISSVTITTMSPWQNGPGETHYTQNFRIN